MTTSGWQPPYEALLHTLGLTAHPGLPAIAWTVADPLVASPHRLAQAAGVAAAAGAAAIGCAWHVRTGKKQGVQVDGVDAIHSLNTSAFLRQNGHRIGFGSGQHEPLNAFYATRDGRWFRFVGSRQHHRDAILHGLGCGNYRDSLAAAIAKIDAATLEEQCRVMRVPGVMTRSTEEWRSSAQGRHLAALPVVRIEQIGDSPPEPLPPAEQALSGVRVLEMTQVLAGPAAARSMAAHGAHVLRLSAPGAAGDPGYMAIDTGFGKRNAFLDIHQPASLETLHDLVRGTDVFAQSIRPGSLARRGLAPADLARTRPGLIYLSVSCYGDGPWEERVGFDPNALAATGVCLSEAGGGPPRLPPTSLLSDYLTGQLAAAGVVAALCRRATSGGSYHVSVSLARTAMWVQDLGLLPPEAYGHAASTLSTASTRLMTTASPFGELTHLPPFPTFSDSVARWRHPPRPLGEAPASWDLAF